MENEKINLLLLDLRIGLDIHGLLLLLLFIIYCCYRKHYSKMINNNHMQTEFLIRRFLNWSSEIICFNQYTNINIYNLIESYGKIRLICNSKKKLQISIKSVFDFILFDPYLCLISQTFICMKKKIIHFLYNRYGCC